MLAAVAAFISGYSAMAADEWAVKIGDETVSMESFENYYGLFMKMSDNQQNGESQNTGPVDTLSAGSASSESLFLENLIASKVLYRYAISSGTINAGDIRTLTEMAGIDAAAQYYYNEKVMRTILIAEDEIREYHDQSLPPAEIRRNIFQRKAQDKMTELREGYYAEVENKELLIDDDTITRFHRMQIKKMTGASTDDEVDRQMKESAGTHPFFNRMLFRDQMCLSVYLADKAKKDTGLNHREIETFIRLKEIEEVGRYYLTQTVIKNVTVTDDEISSFYNQYKDSFKELSIEDKLVVTRARKVQKFLSQPFAVAEAFTGRSGKYVKLDDTVRGFKEILAGLHDDKSEDDFYMKGGIEEVGAKA